MSFSIDSSYFLEQLVLSTLRKRVSAPKTLWHAICESCLGMIENAMCPCLTPKLRQSPSVFESSTLWPQRRVFCQGESISERSWAATDCKEVLKTIFLHLRHDVCSASDGLLARLALPDSDRVALDCVLAAECADVAGVLCDFHLLHLLS
jgi:hypothetical protein